MLETFTPDTFRPHVGKLFRVLVDEERYMPAALVAVEVLTNDGDTRRKRTPFTLIFRGPAGGHLPQHIYPVQSEVMEPMELFMVPLGPDAHGMLYECVFT
jgi:hypothetical protein